MQGSSTVTASTAASLAAILPRPSIIGQPDGRALGYPPPGGLHGLDHRLAPPIDSARSRPCRPGGQHTCKVTLNLEC